MMTVSWRQAMRSISGAVRVVLAGTLMAGAASVVHGQPLKDVIAETGAGNLGGAFRLLIGGDTEEDITA